ncbi:TrkH family potassium uptake protein [Candidatus Synechococcus calcipolaris G9]|uniref:TrkH family potassium uptake protein n=1 Tax=Candidatus Synechococcus calcipolaris G9 TaxID=1497997 RepID=A0ABT6EXT0_9SYNE|nr:TrkH family potassium uptake protein [Candidatus Synechococcus calcipolaris]MDG2990583.1 TrkH family potassium uptake protein [Candidatus Synechococcus calcipolaris G9]
MTVPRTICLGFLTVIAIGTVLLMLPFATSSGEWNQFIVALFTATSAVCVTGHIVVDTATYFSPLGQVIILLLIQVGGLGYMTANTFLIILLGRKFNLREKIAIQQALDRQGIQGARQLVRSIFGLTLLFEITGIIVLWFVFQGQFSPQQSLWFALFHSISAWNNAGFSLFSDNLIGFQMSVPLNFMISALIIFGGIGYEVIFEFYTWMRECLKLWANPGRLARKAALMNFSLNFKIVTSTTAVLLILGTVAFFFTETRSPQEFDIFSTSQQILLAWFQSVTARTAGFNTIDIGSMANGALVITIALMFIGGSPGGTAGGIKTTTLRILTGITKSTLRGKENVLLYERQVPTSLILKAVAVTVGSFFMVILSTTFIAISEPDIDFIKILFEVVSAFATVGLSTGITASLSIISKVLLIITMFVGRVGVLLLMGAVIGDPRPTSVHYPEENLLVG